MTAKERDDNLYKSARNVPKVEIMPVAELNAGDICRCQKILFTKDAFLSLLEADKTSPASPKGYAEAGKN